VLTSAQAGARALARMIPVGSRVLVVGGGGLVAAVEGEGLVAVEDVAAEPVAVVQGWSPELAWPLLAEGAYALARGLPWVATNVDLTLPTARGEAPGNGSFVRLLAAVTGREPDVVAGKPGPMMLLDAAGSDGRGALVVGDRLDTDIAGAVAAGLDSLLVLTGVTGPLDLLAAAADERPTYVARDLSGLAAVPSTPAAVGDSSWVCGQARVSLVGDELVVSDAGTPEDLLNAVCLAAWTCADRGRRAGLDSATLTWLDEPSPRRR
jgi:glycerol-1-phosphatase